MSTPLLIRLPSKQEFIGWMHSERDFITEHDNCFSSDEALLNACLVNHYPVVAPPSDELVKLASEYNESVNETTLNFLLAGHPYYVGEKLFDSEEEARFYLWELMIYRVHLDLQALKNEPLDEKPIIYLGVELEKLGFVFHYDTNPNSCDRWSLSHTEWLVLYDSTSEYNPIRVMFNNSIVLSGSDITEVIRYLSIHAPVKSKPIGGLTDKSVLTKLGNDERETVIPLPETVTPLESDETATPAVGDFVEKGDYTHLWDGKTWVVYPKEEFLLDRKKALEKQDFKHIEGNKFSAPMFSSLTPELKDNLEALGFVMIRRSMDWQDTYNARNDNPLVSFEYVTSDRQWKVFVRPLSRNKYEFFYSVVGPNSFMLETNSPAEVIDYLKENIPMQDQKPDWESLGFIKQPKTEKWAVIYIRELEGSEHLSLSIVDIYPSYDLMHFSNDEDGVKLYSGTDKCGHHAIKNDEQECFDIAKEFLENYNSSTVPEMGSVPSWEEMGFTPDKNNSLYIKGYGSAHPRGISRRLECGQTIFGYRAWDVSSNGRKPFQEPIFLCDTEEELRDFAYDCLCALAHESGF